MSEWVSESLSHWVIVSTDLTDVTLVSDDTYGKDEENDNDDEDDEDDKSYVVIKVI